jgi:hypothetical protein
VNEEWWKVLFGGFLGTVVGVVVSVIVALYVIRHEVRHQRQLALEERRGTACLALLNIAYELLRSCNDMFRHFQDESVLPSAYEDAIEMNSKVAFGLPFAVAVGSPVNNPYLMLAQKVQDFETLLTTAMSPHEYFTALTDIQGRIQDVLKAIREFLELSTRR